MTWNELLRTELRRLYAQEEVAALTFAEMLEHASGTITRTILRETIDGVPARLARLEMILGDLHDPRKGKSLHSFDGWREDVREMGQGPPLEETRDTAILALFLRMLRARTACYEVASILARSLNAEKVANLLGALLISDRALDARVAETLARVVIEGEGRWDLKELHA